MWVVGYIELVDVFHVHLCSSHLPQKNLGTKVYSAGCLWLATAGSQNA